MKLPIYLRIEDDTIWTEYRKECDAAKVSVESLRKFVERWKEIYPFRIDQVIINEDVLAVVRSEKPERQDLIATNILLPQAIFRAMQCAKEYTVPLNTAFIQGNGGIGAFEGSDR